MRLILGISGLLLTGLFVIYISNTKTNSNSIDTDTVNIKQQGSRIPKNWSGIAVSYDNKLYVDPEEKPQVYQAGVLSLQKWLILMTQDEFSDDDKLFDYLVDKYANIIGWNGIFQTIQDTQVILGYQSATRYHWLGESLMAHSDTAKHAMEIASVDMLHRAPMHGVVWAYIEELGTDDRDKLQKLIYEDLCFFQDMDNQGRAWLSC